jgi:hypothetical protein
MERTKISKAVAWAILSSSVALSGAAYSADNAKSTPSATERSASPRDDRARQERQATQQQGDRVWASDLIGKNVAMAGDRKGEIKDLIVNTRTGEIRHVVTEAGDRLYAVPARMFQMGEGGKLTLNVDQKWLAQRKSWSDDKWPSMTDPATGMTSGPPPAAQRVRHRTRRRRRPAQPTQRTA